MTDLSMGTSTLLDEQTDTRSSASYSVVLKNNRVTPFNVVVHALCVSVPAMTKDKAFVKAKEAHDFGESVVAEGDKAEMTTIATSIAAFKPIQTEVRGG